MGRHMMEMGTMPGAMPVPGLLPPPGLGAGFLPPTPSAGLGLCLER